MAQTQDNRQVRMRRLDRGPRRQRRFNGPPIKAGAECTSLKLLRIPRERHLLSIGPGGRGSFRKPSRPQAVPEGNAEGVPCTCDLTL